MPLAVARQKQVSEGEAEPPALRFFSEHPPPRPHAPQPGRLGAAALQGASCANTIPARHPAVLQQICTNAAQDLVWMYQPTRSQAIFQAMRISPSHPHRTPLTPDPWQTARGRHLALFVGAGGLPTVEGLLRPDPLLATSRPPPPLCGKVKEAHALPASASCQDDIQELLPKNLTCSYRNPSCT